MSRALRGQRSSWPGITISSETTGSFTRVRGFVAFGRPFGRNPDWPRAWRRGFRIANFDTATLRWRPDTVH